MNNDEDKIFASTGAGNEPSEPITLEGIKKVVDNIQTSYERQIAQLINSIDGVKVVLDPMLHPNGYEIHVGCDLYEGIKRQTNVKS